MRTRKTMWTAAVAIALGAIGAAACDNPNSTSPAPIPAPATPAPNSATTPPPNAVTNTNGVVGSPVGVDPLLNVTNRDRIKGDPNATKIDPPKPATLITGFSTMVRESPRGSMIETVQTTANVNEVAKSGDYYLVTYPDPKGSNKTYGGWVYKDALESATWAAQGQANAANAKNAPPKLSCASGESHVRTTRDFCAKTCADDTNCDAKTNQICDGLAFKVDEGSNKTSDVRYCVSQSDVNAIPGSHGSEHGSSSTLPK